jgi:hypothetical protein
MSGPQSELGRRAQAVATSIIDRDAKSLGFSLSHREKGPLVAAVFVTLLWDAFAEVLADLPPEVRARVDRLIEQRKP